MHSMLARSALDGLVDDGEFREIVESFLNIFTLITYDSKVWPQAESFPTLGLERLRIVGNVPPGRKMCQQGTKK